MEKQQSVDAEAEEGKSGSKRLDRWFRKGGEKQEDEADCKKTQAQRLFEFELWTDGQTFKDLEYSQRRTEKKQRRQERKQAARNRLWKKLYLPAMLFMLGGTILTLCGTLRSMGGDSVLWEVRGALIVLGPVLLGLGFLALMLAAGCTFEHDQEDEEETKQVADPFAEFLLKGVESQTNSSSAPRPHRRPAAALRSVSMDTADLPIPDDLDPDKNYVLAKPGWAVGGRNERKESTSSTVNTVFLDASNSYASTASWVRSVSACHSSLKNTLTRQNSDSNLLAGRSSERYVPDRRSSLLVDYPEGRDPAGSHSDLRVVCTRSWASSGYQSASDSTSGPAEYHLSSEHHTEVDVVFSWASLRHAASRSRAPSDSAVKTPVRKPGLPRHRSHSTACHHGLQRTPVHSGLRPGHAEPRGYRGRERSPAPSSTRTRSNVMVPCSSRGSSVQGRSKMGFNSRRNEASSRINVAESSYTEMSELKTAGLPFGSEEKRNFAHGKSATNSVEHPHPVVLQPAVYTLGSVRCTDV